MTFGTKAMLVSSLFSGSSVIILYLSNSVTTLLMIPLIMHHCSKVILTIHERQSSSFLPKMPLQLICYYLLIKSMAILIGTFSWNVKLYSFPSIKPQRLNAAKTLDDAADSLNCLSCLLRCFRKPVHIFIVERTASPMSLSQFSGNSIAHHCPIISQKSKEKIFFSARWNHSKISFQEVQDCLTVGPPILNDIWESFHKS